MDMSQKCHFIVGSHFHTQENFRGPCGCEFGVRTDLQILPVFFPSFSDWLERQLANQKRCCSCNGRLRTGTKLVIELLVIETGKVTQTV